MKYKITEIYKSFQGEGTNTGKEMIFIRFAGCNLNCEWCDTNYSNFMEMRLNRIVNKVGLLSRGTCKWVLLTGGEPTIQGLYPLVKELKNQQFYVAIETNGTNPIHYYFHLNYISVSPKPRIPVYKIRVDKANEVRVVNTNFLTTYYITNIEKKIQAKDYYISPLETEGSFNIYNSLALLNVLNKRKEGKQWRISLQMHKIASIR